MAMLNNQRVYGGYMTSDDRGRSGNPPHMNIPTGPKKFTSHGFLGSIIATQTVSNKPTIGIEPGQSAEIHQQYRDVLSFDG